MYGFFILSLLLSTSGLNMGLCFAAFSLWFGPESQNKAPTTFEGEQYRLKQHKGK